MSVVNPRIQVKDSRHKVVFSHDEDVLGPKWAGWIPLSACDSVRESADQVEVRSLTADEFAHYIETAGSTSQTATLAAVRAGVVAVNGKTEAEAVLAWIGLAFRSNPTIVRYLGEYILFYSRGFDPVEILHPEIQEVFGILATFPQEARPEAEVDPEVAGSQVAPTC